MTKWFVLLGVLALLTLSFLVGVKLLGPSKLERAEAFAEHGPRRALSPLWPAPAFAAVDHRAATVTNQSLAGRVWVANFIFTQCKTICPLLTAKMVQLQQRLGGLDVQFVSFSVDPTNDTPAVLAAYASKWAPDEPRWTLLSTTPQTLPDIAQGFRITAQPNTPGSLDAIMHSAVFVLVDGSGLIRGVFDSEDRKDFVALEQATRQLLGAPAPAPTQEPLTGLDLYHAHSCGSCHEAAELAPSLFGRAGTLRELDNGLTATFDAAYVREALLQPDAKRVRGYPLHMPGYEGLLSEAGLTTLTEYLLTAPADAPADVTATVEVDPVCHMKVRATPQALSIDHAGRRVFFCSSHCQSRFRASPEAFQDRPGRP